MWILLKLIFTKEYEETWEKEGARETDGVGW